MPQSGRVENYLAVKTSYSWYFVLAFVPRTDERSPVKVPLRFLRRLGPDPHAKGAKTVALNGCPDLFELSSGDFAVIGIDVTEEGRKVLPPSAGCGPDERIVLVPRKTLILAKPDIPDGL